MGKLPEGRSNLVSEQYTPVTVPTESVISVVPPIPNQPNTPMKKRRSKLLIGCGSLVGIFFVCTTLACIGSVVTGGSKTPTTEDQSSGTTVAAANTVPTPTTESTIVPTTSFTPTPAQATDKPTATLKPPTAASTEKPTVTPKPPTVTPTEKPTAIPKPPTATATAPPIAVPPPNKSQATYLDPRILAAEPKAHVGEHVYLQGKTLTVDQNSDYTWVQIMAQVKDKDYVTESVIVEMRPKQTKLLRSECYRIYGIVKGTTKVTRTATGAENEVPLVYGYEFEAAPVNQYGSCVNS